MCRAHSGDCHTQRAAEASYSRQFPIAASLPGGEVPKELAEVSNTAVTVLRLETEDPRRRVAHGKRLVDAQFVIRALVRAVLVEVSGSG
jgi:hypothetical protein